MSVVHLTYLGADNETLQILQALQDDCFTDFNDDLVVLQHENNPVDDDTNADWADIQQEFGDKTVEMHAIRDLIGTR